MKSQVVQLWKSKEYLYAPAHDDVGDEELGVERHFFGYVLEEIDWILDKACAGIHNRITDNDENKCDEAEVKVPPKDIVISLTARFKAHDDDTNFDDVWNGSNKSFDDQCGSIEVKKRYNCGIFGYRSF